MKAKIIHLIQKTEQTIDQLKFMFSPMPTSEGFMDSLQVVLLRYSNWESKVSMDHFMTMLYRPHHALNKLFGSETPNYWETNKLDIKRTIARMSRNGGIL